MKKPPCACKGFYFITLSSIKKLENQGRGVLKAKEFT